MFQEGRGAGKGCFYWATQQHLPVSRVDKVLDDVLHYLDPNLKDNITFQEACSASNQEVGRLSSWFSRCACVAAFFSSSLFSAV